MRTPTGCARIGASTAGGHRRRIAPIDDIDDIDRAANLSGDTP